MAEEAWTVLVVDDDHEVRERMMDLLTVEGFAVLAASNGARGLAWLRVLPGRCLVLLDLDMPVMNGHEFLLELHKIPESGARCPVIVMSGVPGAEVVLKMPGVMALLRKPTPARELLATVREHVTPVGQVMP